MFHNTPMKMKPIDVNYIRTRLKYIPETGDFVWLVSSRGHRKAGDRAGSINGQGYWRIKVDQITYMGHRLAWALYHGKSPDLEIDHIDGNPLNNRISNLREASRWENCSNVKGAGVSFDKTRGKWLARISVKETNVHVGRYDTFEEAKAAVDAAKLIYRGDFANVTR